MSIGIKMENAIKNNLGWDCTKTSDVRAVRQGKPWVVGCTETFCIVTCVENDVPYIEAMMQLIGESDANVKIIVKKGKTHTPTGEGFGDRLWRRNDKRGGVEISFSGSPDANVRELLKRSGFRWSHTNGVWYVSEKKYNEEAFQMVVNTLKLIRTEDVF